MNMSQTISNNGFENLENSLFTWDNFLPVEQGSNGFGVQNEDFFPTELVTGEFDWFYPETVEGGFGEFDWSYPELVGGGFGELYPVDYPIGGEFFDFPPLDYPVGWGIGDIGGGTFIPPTGGFIGTPMSTQEFIDTRINGDPFGTERFIQDVIQS